MQSGAFYLSIERTMQLKEFFFYQLIVMRYTKKFAQFVPRAPRFPFHFIGGINKNFSVAHRRESTCVFCLATHNSVAPSFFDQTMQRMREYSQRQLVLQYSRQKIAF